MKLSMTRLIKIEAFILLITGLFYSYTLYTRTQTEKDSEILIVEEKEIVEADQVHTTAKKPDVHRYYIYGSGLIQQNLMRFCKDTGIHSYDRFLDRNIVEDESSTLIFATARPLDHISMERLEALIEKGVSVIFAAGIPEEPEFHEMLGIRRKNGMEDLSEFGIRKGFLPFMEETMKCPDYNLSDRIITENDVTPLVWDEETEIPILYEREEGNSKITVFNTRLLEDMGNMGLFTGAIARIEGDLIYPVVGNTYLFLDHIHMGDTAGDEMLAVRGQKKTKFVLDKIWPVFAADSLRTDLPLTVSYPLIDVKEHRFSEAQKEYLLEIAAEVMKTDGEITMGGHFGRWENLIFYDKFRNEFLEHFPNYGFRGLEELSGHMDEGKKQLMTESYPELKTVRRSVYDMDGNYNFDSESVEHELVAVPLYSEGIGKDGDWLWDVSMSVSARGILSHRLDLEEIGDLRNGTKNWEKNERELMDFWKRGPEKADWLNGTTLSRGINEIRGYKALNYDLTHEKNIITIRLGKYLPGQKFYLRTEKAVEDIKGGRIRAIGKEYYLIKADSCEVSIVFE